MVSQKLILKPQLYLINDSKKDWENCYIMKNVRDNLNNVDTITIREVVKDAFTFILFTPRFCRELIEETEAMASQRIYT